MIQRVMFFLALCLTCLVMHTTSEAQLFFTENFDYADGDLNTVSGGLWPTHSGGEGEIQVVDGNAVVMSPGSFDHNRQTGVVAGANDVWYYAVRFTVELGAGVGINNDYFVHFKDESTFGFNARLAINAPVDMANDFSLDIAASSLGDGTTSAGDFSFGQELICVVCWNNGTGVATLWVNPADMSSPSVSDDELPDAMRLVESVALRQDSGNGMDGSSEVTVAALAAGTDFDAVHEAVMGGGDVLVGDVNCDGSINLLDVAPFVGFVSSGEFNEKADINGDGSVDLLDVAPFVDLLTAG